MLAVPAIGALVGRWNQREMDVELREGLVRANAPPEVVASASMEDVCRDRRVRVEACRLYRGFRAITIISIATGIAGLVLIGVIAFAARAAARDRSRLVLLFRPGLYGVALCVSLLVLAHGLVIIASILFLAGNRPLGLLLTIGIGTVAGVIAIVRNTFSMVREAESHVLGRAVTRDEAPALWQLVDDVASRLQSLKPDQIVVGLDPSFFVTEAAVQTPGGRLTGRTLFCSLSFARILTVREFASIVGHELGHFRGEDTKFSKHFYPIYRGSTDAFQALQVAGEGVRVVSLLPALATIGFFIERFAIAERTHGRQREHVADAASVEATDVTASGTALVKVHAFGGAWFAWHQHADQELRQSKLAVNVSAEFASIVHHNVRPEMFDGIADARTSHPTDTHPTLGERLDVLGVTLEGLIEAASNVAPSDAAIGLVPGHEHIEAELSFTYQGELARAMGIQIRPQGEAGSSARTCNWCGALAVPTEDGRCPSCQTRM